LFEIDSPCSPASSVSSHHGDQSPGRSVIASPPAPAPVVAAGAGALMWQRVGELEKQDERLVVGQVLSDRRRLARVADKRGLDHDHDVITLALGVDHAPTTPSSV
jgi:hypothetical protein